MHIIEENPFEKGFEIVDKHRCLRANAVRPYFQY